jgi:integrase
MYYKNGRYYYVRDNHWHTLSRDYTEALVQRARLEAPTGDWEKLVAVVYERYEARYKAGDLTSNAFKQYCGLRPRIEYGFAEFHPRMVRTSDITAFLDEYENTPNTANRMLTIIKAVFERGVRRGLCDTNPAYGIKRFEEGKRDRYLQDWEFNAIRSRTNPHTQLIMDMCYLTGQRISDVLAIQHKDITSEGVYFKQGKTGQRVLVNMSDELGRVVREAKALHKVMALYLFHPTGKATRYSYKGIRDNYMRAAVAAGVKDTRLHDLRAKAATDAEAEGIDPQALMGHASAAMTKRYLRLRKTVQTDSPSLRRLLEN